MRPSGDLISARPWQAWPFRRAHPAATQKPRAARTCTCRAVGAEFAGRTARRPPDRSGGNQDGRNRRRHPFRTRARNPTQARRDRRHRRNRHRVVRLLSLQRRDRAGVRQALLPEIGPAGRYPAGLAVYAVGFVARPIGAAIFGHYGDRIGRKAALIATLLLMGIATFLVALVPTYEQAGIWGAVILTVLRFIQGIGVGGEWGGSVLMSMEWARSSKSRGFIASWPQFGVPCGLFLANLAVLAFSQMSGEQFLAWGWRIPFVLSLLLVVVGLYIRLGILETPIFRKLVAEQ